ncbi:putative nucleotidyltransferase substrate binding domain-containing protein [Marinicella meishanensis]|uniref:putative nucleotidyltransferase substrate binding domain-containing protein n=1 Tax=Marinicella meishanensis TaxID=2873263 RepID=UPI001CBB4F3D|nr:putative nucleotidyltransferase substrate binding domain-containing protein [Marinicella sp. NBU2979]
MEIEQLEIHDFLQQTHPLNKLDGATLKQLATAIEITYHPREDVVLEPGHNNHWLYMIRSGAVIRTDHQDGLVAQFGSGDFFGHRAIERGGLIKNKVSCLEDSLFYLIPDTLYHTLMQEVPAFNDYFSQQKNQRLKSALHELQANHDNILIKSRVADFLHPALTIDASLSIQDTAQLMQQQDKTSALVLDAAEKTILGIVTDRAFCTKVVADGIPAQQSIDQVMTHNPVCIDPHSNGLEAMLLMTRLNIRHLPVVQDGSLVGMVTATDLIHHQSHNPIYLVNEIHKATDLAQVVSLSQQIPTALVKLVAAGLHAKDIAHSISSIGRAIIQKVIKQTIQELGPAPIRFAYLVAGSLARNDQTAHSDQDNGLLLADNYEPAQHGCYFQQLASTVSDWLNRCGYVYCPGDVMASNEQWRQPLAVWQSYFERWILTPEPKALMYASIFFDLRCVYGDASLLDELHESVKQLIQQQRRFLAFMAANAQQNKPPLGLFRRFVLEQHGAEHKTLDMKKRGILPLTDVARVFALDAGTALINTRDRIQAACQAGVISSEAADDLIDSHDFLCTVRLQHQVKNIQAGQAANNHVNPDELSSLERRHLKDAFELISTYQDVVSQKYNQGQL